MISIFDIHKRLGLNHENGLFTRKDTPSLSSLNIKDSYKGDFSGYKSNFKVEYALKKLQPHSFFLFNNEPLFLFFDFQSITKSQKEKLSEQIWNFNKSAIAFVNTSTKLIVYNGFQFDKKTNLLTVLETINKITDIAKIEQFSYWKIVTSELWNAKDEEFKKKTRVDTKLLENIKATREVLTNKDDENRLSEKHANRIIGRLIFVRYLIDRNVKLDFKGTGKELLSKYKLPELITQKNNLFDFFEYLLTKFKGDLLPLNGERNAVQGNHLNVLANLFAGNNIKSRQQSLFNIFDFDFIPIELISNIYETFLGEKQNSDKAFYTPPFLVDYILEQTVKPYVSKLNNTDEIGCKIVDFTCGSGIFLCETLRTLINRYIELTKPDKSSNKFKNDIKELIVKNIYGNDINEEAIEIAKFSLFITLLDYFDPKDIEDFEFPDISGNFHSHDVFNTELVDNKFSSELDNVFGAGKSIEPDFIIGNPPWGKLDKKSKYLSYIKDREKKENKELKEKNGNDFKPVNIDISNKEFAQAFLLRLSDFSSENTSCQIIVTSKLLYNLNADKFRNYFLTNFTINEVLEISSVRHQIFANAVGPAAIIKYQYSFSKETKDNVIDYVSLKPNPYFAIFKSILIEKHDYKEIIQKELIKNDWLWKVLVYGHILDYRFIERLKTLPTINEIITEKSIIDSRGVQIGSRKYPVNYSGKQFINTQTSKIKKNSDLQHFYINYRKDSKWIEKYVDRKRVPELFEAPILLFKAGLTSDFKVIGSISYSDVIFTKSVYGLKQKSESNILEILLGLISSDLFNYFILNIGSSSGIERGALNDEEIKIFPYKHSNKIQDYSLFLIKLKRLIEIHKRKPLRDNIKITEYEEKFQQKEAELNELIFDLYKLSDTERELISYAQEITIPILQARKKKFREIRGDIKLYKPYKEVEKEEIENYVNLFIEHFSKFHQGGERGYINAIIYQSKNILAIEFKIEENKKELEWKNELDNDKALELLAGLGFQKISNQLFTQKDVKVLRSKSFSVLKIKQYKYWHKAIARLDIVEFMEAMIESQKQTSNAKN